MNSQANIGIGGARKRPMREYDSGGSAIFGGERGVGGEENWLDTTELDQQKRYMFLRNDG
jgi:hypothetical protein